MKSNASANWDRKYTKNYSIQVTLTTEKDIYEKLESVDSKSGYIKELIKKDIMEGKNV